MSIDEAARVADEGSSAEELRARLVDLEVLYGLADAIGRAGSIEETLDEALASVTAALDLERAAVLLADADGVMRFAAWRGLSDDYRAVTTGHSPWPSDASDPESVLVPDVEQEPSLAPLRDRILEEGIRALAFVPLVHRGRLLGKFMLYRGEPGEWSEREIRLTQAVATHIAAASQRHAATGELLQSRSQLEAVLRQVADGITVQDASGHLVYANDAAAVTIGFPSADALLAAPLRDVIDRFELYDEDRRPLALEELPGRRALAGEEAVERLVLYRVRATGEERWSVVRASPIRGPGGDVVFAVNTFHDTTERKVAADRVAFLAEAGEVLSSSLDVEETLRALSRLAVPALADWCVVDLLEPDGVLRRVASAHADPARQPVLERVESPRGYRRVIAEGTPLLLAVVDEEKLREVARSPEHLADLRSLAPRSLVSVPLVARGQTLGAITLVSSDERQPYGELDVSLASELGRRAALAVDNALLHRETGAALGALDSFVASAPVAIGFFDRELRYLRVNDELARMNGLPPEEHLGRTLSEVVPDIADLVEPIYRQVLETGEAVTREESSGTLTPRLGPDRYWIARYFPVRDERGSTVGVGVLLTDITERRRLADKQAFLAEVSDALASSRDYEQTLREVARLAVPRLADWCVVYEADEGRIRRLAVEHAGGQAERVAAVLARHPVVPDAAEGVPKVIRTGEPLHVTDLAGPVITADVVDPEGLARELEDVALTEYLCVPLVARGRTLGAISLLNGDSGRSFGDADREFALELARRASFNIDNARLLREAEDSAAKERRRSEQLLRLSHAVLLVSSASDLDEMLAVLTAQAREIVGAHEATTVYAGEDPAAEPLQAVARADADLTVDESAQTLTAPLVGRDGRALGSIALRGTESGDAFTEEDYAIVVQLAQMASVAVENARLLASVQESAAILDAQNETVIDGLLLVSPEGRMLSFNRRFAEIWGMPRDVLATGSDDAALAIAMERVVDPQAFIERVRYLYEHPDEESRDEVLLTDGRVLDRYGTAVRTPDGTYHGYLWSFRDVTDERRLFRREQQARERLALLAEVSHLLSQSLDYEETLAAVSRIVVPALADWCAISVLEDDGSINVVAWTHSDPERQRWADEMRSVRRIHIDDATPTAQVLRTGEPVLIPEITDEVLASVQPADVELVAAMGIGSLMAVPFTSARGTVGSIMFVSAESGRRFDDDDLLLARELGRRAGVAIENARLYSAAEARAKAAEALEFVDDGVLLVGRDGVVRVWNPQAQAITGLREHEVEGRRVDEAIPGWESLVARVPVVDAREAGRSRSEIVPLELDGRELWLSMSGVAFEAGTVYAFRDVTEERGLERMKSDFVSTVSHELRTPLAAIYGAALTLRRPDMPLPDDQRQMLLGVIADEADRLARIVNDILWTSRIESGGLHVQIESCDAADLASSVVQAAQLHVPPTVDLSLDVDDDLPRVAADPDKVRQVIANLVDNAVKYSPEGGRVVVRLTATAGSVRFAVCDEGLGIPPGERDRIFEKFYRLDPDLNRGVGGTGLGLYICRELVRRMDGSIWIEGNDPRGSRAVVELPAVT